MAASEGSEVAAAGELDFVVVGCGAGGSIAAATLAQAGARVLVLEEGVHHTRHDFNMQEAWAYPALYQDRGNRATDDLSIMILQGRSVGGGTTINWTSSFRAPARTLALWASRHGVRGLDQEALAPHFAAVEERLSVGPGNPDDVNANNRKLLEGARALGWGPELIPRSVKGCARLGYCGMGCPLDAKQSALVTFVPDAVAAGADVLTGCRVTRIEADGRRATAVHADTLDEETTPRRAGQGHGHERASPPARRALTFHPRRGVVLAGGAINTPALLLRSKVGNRNGRVGRRTFLHPAVPIVGFFREPIEAYYGAPQSVACQHFADRGERMGYFLETAPVHPMLASIAFPGFGDPHRRIAERLPHVQATIALAIDGHHSDEGGTVRADDDGRIRLAYPLSALHREAFVDALENLARLLFAAGAAEVMTLHTDPLVLRGVGDIPRIKAAPFGPNLHTLFSAHQMGGCAMGSDPAASVVNSVGRHHQLDNLWIADGSVFPTSLGINPQMTIYAVARLIATAVARS